MEVFWEGEVTQVDSSQGQQMRHRKETPTESKCPETIGKNYLVEDAVLQIQGDVSQYEDMSWQSRLPKQWGRLFRRAALSLMRRILNSYRRTAFKGSTELWVSLFWCSDWSDGCTTDADFAFGIVHIMSRSPDVLELTSPNWTSNQNNDLDYS